MAMAPSEHQKWGSQEISPEGPPLNIDDGEIPITDREQEDVTSQIEKAFSSSNDGDPAEMDVNSIFCSKQNSTQYSVQEPPTA